MKDFIKSIILTGNYILSEMEERIQRMYVIGKITDLEMSELLELAAENADDIRQINIAAMLADLEQRVAALEAKGVQVWVSGMITARGQTVLYDVDKDGTLDYCRYDGGRATTASSPGKIEGWVKTDANGNATHRIVKDENNQIVLVLIEPEPEPTEPTEPDGNEQEG